MERDLSSGYQKDVKKKKKNKKKKKSGGVKAKFSSDLDNENEDVEEITRIVDKMFGTSSHQQENLRDAAKQNHHNQAQNVLYVQHKNLNPQTEVKRMFGKVVNQEQHKKRRAGNRPLRSVIMTNPKENWPPITRNGLSMNLVPAPEGDNEKNKNIFFAFEHSQRYEIF